MPAPALSYSSYALLNNALQEFGYENLSSFYNTAFADKFGGVKWRDTFALGDASISETYTQITTDKGLPVMAQYVSFDAEGPVIANEGFAMSSGDMPVMKLGFNFNDKSMKETEKILQLGGQVPLQPVFDKFLVNNAKIIGGIHSLINYTAYQVESTGAFTTTVQNNTGGIRGLQFDFQIPAINKKKAGGYGSNGTKYVWSVSGANPIGDLRDMYKYSVDNLIPVDVFRMNKATWELLLNHATTKVAVNTYLYPTIASGNISSIPMMPEVVKQYIVNLGLPPIEVVEDVSLVEVYDPATAKMVRKSMRGFADNTVVLRQAGLIGTLQWSMPSLAFATAANPAFLTENGMMRVAQYIDSRAEAMKFEAKFIGIPVLENPEFMLYLDTATAAD